MRYQSQIWNSACLALRLSFHILFRVFQFLIHIYCYQIIIFYCSNFVTFKFKTAVTFFPLIILNCRHLHKKHSSLLLLNKSRMRIRFKSFQYDFHLNFNIIFAGLHSKMGMAVNRSNKQTNNNINTNICYKYYMFKCRITFAQIQIEN